MLQRTCCSIFVICHHCWQQGKNFEFFILKFIQKSILKPETVSKKFFEEKELQNLGQKLLRKTFFCYVLRGINFLGLTVVNALAEKSFRKFSFYSSFKILTAQIQIFT